MTKSVGIYISMGNRNEPKHYTINSAMLFELTTITHLLTMCTGYQYIQDGYIFGFMLYNKFLLFILHE